MTNPEVWFFIVGVLFIGFFVLDGFDFGVGMALPFLGKDDTDKRVIINTIGPVWDMNETWVIVAGASLFAAFPEWYSTLFSGAYLALLLILIAMILRGVSFEYRHQVDPSKRVWFDWMIFIGSALPALLWGVAFANIINGLPIIAMEPGVAVDGLVSSTGGHVFTGNLFTLLNPYALVGGLTTLSLFLTHGLVFLSLKTEGDIQERARKAALKSGIITVVLAVVFLGWTLIAHFSVAVLVSALLAAVALLAGLGFTLANRNGWAFTSLALTVVFAVFAMFMVLYTSYSEPMIMPSTTGANEAEMLANSLTIANASSSAATLKVMNWVAIIALPIVIAYQAWTFWVFRKRISRTHIEAAPAH